MKYTATVLNTDLTADLLTVVVQFMSEDGSRSTTDTFQTKSAQDPNWLSLAVTRKINELEGLDEFAKTITVGEIALTPKDEAATTEKDTYKEKLAQFERMITAYRKGLMSETDGEFVNLQQWLKDNFKSDYLDLL